jgi:hypothetical protein
MTSILRDRDHANFLKILVPCFCVFYTGGAQQKLAVIFIHYIDLFG